MKRNIQLLISEEFAEKTIPENDSVRLIDEVIDEMDLTPLYHTYSRLGRKSATTPRTLLKVVIYAAMEGEYSSRKMHSACTRDINYIWLLNGEEAPSHHEISRFRSTRLSECYEELFYQLVQKLKDLGEIKFEHLFVDGTKIEANANKYSFVWKKSTTKYEIRLLEKLNKLISDLCLKYMVNCEEPEDLLNALNLKVQTPFVYGRGKRKSELQRDIEQLTELVERKKKYENYQKTFSGRNSFSKTDPSATFMHLKEDHMRNAKLKPAYNLQLAVEGEYITGFDISSERSDQLTLIPLIDKMEKCLGTQYDDVTADAGYESEENYTGNRKMQVSKKFIEQRKQSLANITSPMGILLRTNRSIQAEGVFGVIKENYKFRQLLLRGKKKVETEIAIVAMAYNINKLHHKIQDNRTGTQLHGKLSA